jgi:hypothetical protein
MRDGDPRVRTRAADAAEQAARERPELLAPHADALVDIAREADPELRPYVAQLLARTELSDERAATATEILERYLADEGAAAQAWALSAVTAIANDHPELRPRARERVHAALGSDDETVSTRARALQGQADSWPS